MIKIILAFLIVIIGSILGSIRYWGIKYITADKEKKKLIFKGLTIGLIAELVIFTCILVVYYYKFL